ncbi:hypothetical protein DRF65_10030 [Chryseobacterium pennae]|uniref:Uncharacterized protein n=1 Tax=Chryseobacterium pennae TaxID=2258962 RepID=A0A3D9C975_9FLAO|nr:hypothetical protein [Chryseobacterium pennae]REC62425.1 hypothetical protein DRF65_10030 [Chryseobacterium pennae]
MSYKYLLPTIAFLFLSCKQETIKSESKVADSHILEQEKAAPDSLRKEVTEQKAIPFNLYAEWEGVYSYCKPDERSDGFKSVTCFEISISKNEVTVDGNTLLCIGTYSIKGNKDEAELRYAGDENVCEDHFFRLKREGKKIVLYDFMNPDQEREVKIKKN